MLTRCPACDTHFRVTAEQIKARLGRVRCGACQHAFNALDSLIEEPMLAPAAPSLAARSAAVADPGAELAVSPAPTFVDDSAPTHDVAPMPDAAQNISGFEPPATDLAPSDADASADTGATANTLPDLIAPVPGEEPAIVTPIAADMVPPDASETGTALFGDATTEAEVQNWDEVIAEPLPRRWPWITGSLLALLVLGLQAVLAFRVEMAVVWPEMKPALVSLCDLAGCEVGLPAKVGLVGIEASDLHPDNEIKGRLTLTATLKNRAPFAQEFPHLELTLTDTADKPVARKVLAPADYLPPRTPTADGMPPSADIAVTVRVDSGDMAASGYRLYLFFP